jgi:hypothetical protein
MKHGESLSCSAVSLDFNAMLVSLDDYNLLFLL